jgi:hypothetical protein
MKKVSIKRKKFLYRQAKRKFFHELKKKRWKEMRRYKSLPEKARASNNRKFLKNPSTVLHKEISITGTFSLLKNTQQTMRYFKEIKGSLVRGIPVNLDLSGVTDMGIETLTYYCAFINDPDITHKTALRGNTPRESKLKEMFEKSGFYGYVTSTNESRAYNRDIYSELIHRITKEKVESEITKNVCISSALHTFGKADKTIIQQFQPILVECMANTWNHAGGNEPRKYNWWLLAYNDPQIRMTKFCFLDLGIGIFESLDRAYQTGKLPKFLRWMRPGNNVETLRGIFTRGEKRTGTVNLEGRGEGINYIYTRVKSNPSIKKFTLVSNNIEAKIGYHLRDSIRRIDENFDGTMYYWELSSQNGNN